MLILFGAKATVSNRKIRVAEANVVYFKSCLWRKSKDQTTLRALHHKKETEEDPTNAFYEHFAILGGE